MNCWSARGDRPRIARSVVAGPVRQTTPAGAGRGVGAASRPLRPPATSALRPPPQPRGGSWGGGTRWNIFAVPDRSRPSGVAAGTCRGSSIRRPAATNGIDDSRRFRSSSRRSGRNASSTIAGAEGALAAGSSQWSHGPTRQSRGHCHFLGAATVSFPSLHTWPRGVRCSTPVRCSSTSVNPAGSTRLLGRIEPGWLTPSRRRVGRDHCSSARLDSSDMSPGRRPHRPRATSTTCDLVRSGHSGSVVQLLLADERTGTAGVSGTMAAIGTDAASSVQRTSSRREWMPSLA